jgi:hypothetical protein
LFSFHSEVFFKFALFTKDSQIKPEAALEKVILSIEYIRKTDIGTNPEDNFNFLELVASKSSSTPPHVFSVAKLNI